MKVCLCGTGPGSKRLGIDGDREAVPLTLQIIYSKVRLALGCVSVRGLLLTLPHPESAPHVWQQSPWTEGREWTSFFPLNLQSIPPTPVFSPPHLGVVSSSHME